MLALDPEREAVSSIHAHSNRRPRPGPPISPPTQHYTTTNNNNKQPKQSGSRRSASASEDTSGLKARKALAYGPAYSAEEESLREDFALEYVHSGRRPQNFLLGCDLDKRFEEYPKLQKLIGLHGQLVDSLAIPPTYLHMPTYDLAAATLMSHLSTRFFDCILIDPPDDLSWNALSVLPVPQLAAQPSFVWIWCGSANTDGLERGRELLAKWGYRRCEDIVWIKTNKKGKKEPGTSSVLVQTKEHCLMGIRGTVKRSTDAHFVHCNVDTDVIVWEPDEDDPSAKPPELYHIIENFCLGARRLQLFYPPSRARRGWLTIGTEEPTSVTDVDGDQVHHFDRVTYEACFDPVQGGQAAVPNTPEIDQLRPRSPPPRGGGPSNSGGGIGRGRGHRPPPASIPQRPRLPPAGGGLGAPPPRLQNPLPPHPHFHHQQHQPHHSPSPPQQQQQQQQQQYPQFMPPPPMGVPPMGMGMPGMPGMPGMFGPGAGGMPPGMDMSFNPMMGMFNPMMMGAPPPGPPPQAMDWTAFFQNQANLNHQQNQQNRR